MNDVVNLRLRLSSWVWVGGLIGLCGGAVIGAAFAILNLATGLYLEAALYLLVVPLVLWAHFVVYSAVGYILYRYLVRHFPRAARLRGEFVDGDSDGDPNANNALERTNER
jgi:hypothetical protein